MTPGEHPEVEAILQASVAQADQSAIRLGHRSVLTLVASIKNQIVAAILCDQDDRRGYVCHHPIDNQDAQQWVIKSLVDKALLRLHAMGISQCRIVMPAQGDPNTHWKHFKWHDKTDFAAKPVRSSGAVDQLANQFGGESNNEDVEQPTETDEPDPAQIADESSETQEPQADETQTNPPSDEPTAVVADESVTNNTDTIDTNPEAEPAESLEPELAA